MRKHLLVLAIVAGQLQFSMAQSPYGPPPGYGPAPGYGQGMPQGYYQGPPPGYYPPMPPGYYPPMSPPGYNQGPPGYNPGMPPPGFNPNQGLPPGFNPNFGPQGMSQGPPPGVNPFSGGFVPPGAGGGLPPGVTPPAGGGWMDIKERTPPPESGPGSIIPTPALPPLSAGGPPPGGAQEPPLLPPAASDALPQPQESQPQNRARSAEEEQTPIPDANAYPIHPKKKSCPSCQNGGVFPWYPQEYQPSVPGCSSEEPWNPQPADQYPRGGYTFQTMGGYYQNLGSTKYQYIPFALRWGKLINCPCLGGLGCLEPIIELNGAPTRQLGNEFVGASFILRYNFVQPTCRIVPYVQIGAGVQYNNAYKDQSQDALGQPLEYVGQAQIGVRWFVCRNFSLDVEGGYMYFTNFNQAPRNAGIQAVGGSIGMTYYFPICHR